MLKAVLKLVVVCFTLATFLNTAYADNKVVRVGWYESPFNFKDNFGRRSGYAYDYQQKIAAYTGWTYEYVPGTWVDLYNMLINGQIDILSDVSYTPERANSMLFPSFPMGAEFYYLFISASNNSISGDNIASLNGKRVGANENSYQAALFQQWAANNGINVEFVGLNNPEMISIEKLMNGEIDAFITTDIYEDQFDHATVPIIKIGQSNFFFAVNKNRQDLLNELNFAMSKINEENRFYNDYLDTKYLKSSGTNAFLPNEELNWLAQHGTIRVGYLNDFAPFCERTMTGGVNGLLKNYLELAANCTKNATLTFDTKSYSTLQDALQALVDNEIDCVFPVHLSVYDAESMGIMTTNPFIQTEMYLMTNKSSQKVISADEKIIVAINGTNANYKTFLMDNFPNWTTLDCNSIKDALNAIENEKANCAIVNNYQAMQYSSENYDLYALATGETMEFSFAVRRSDPALYYILNKTASLISTASLQSALTEYSSSNIKFSFGEFLRMHMYLVIVGGLAFTLFVVMLIRRGAKRKEQLLKDQLEVQERQLEVQRKELENEHKAHEVNSMISSIGADYRSIYSVNLERDEGCCYRAGTGKSNEESDLKGIKMGDRFPFREKFTQYANDFVAEVDREKFLKFIEPENIREKLSKEITTGCRYHVIKDGVEQYEMIRIVDTYFGQAPDRINFISVGFAEVDSETRELMEQNRVLSESLKNAQPA
ncbi:MAG: transporter substrate-binding domain-containing protein [Selenomonadaceae bacterium]|nr:transporter substrate-binding domain-containing protein [Selenomonadaceae bacterium]